MHRSFVSASNSAIVKVPNVPKNDHGFDYLTDGSNGSLDKRRTVKQHYDNSPTFTMNRTALIRDHLLDTK